jgi:hypothetical protein
MFEQEDIDEAKIKKAIQSEDCSPEDFLILIKMLAAKKGWSYSKWEEMFHEQEDREALRQFGGISEDLVTDIISCSIRALFEHTDKEVGRCFSFDQYDGKLLTCTICPEKPYRAGTFELVSISGNRQGLVIIAVVCKNHFQRLEKRDGQVLQAIVNTAMQRRNEAEI